LKRRRSVPSATRRGGGEPLSELTGQPGATAAQPFDPVAREKEVEASIDEGELRLVGPHGRTLFVQGLPSG
jgi:hypothetical protein